MAAPSAAAAQASAAIGARLVERPPGAVLFHAPGAACGAEVTAATLLRAAHRVAAALPDATAVLNPCRDRLAFTAVFLAAQLRGVPCVPVNDRAPDALRAVAACFPGAVAVTEAADAALAVLPAVCTGAALVAADAAGPVPENPLLPADHLAAVVFTSGSTGAPVAHPKPWGALAARSRAAGERFGLHEAAPVPVVGTVPPGHMYGFETTVLLPLHAAARSWCGPAFYPADLRAALAAAPAPALLVTTPLQLRALLDAGGPAPRLRGVISATAPLDAALAARAEAAWGVPLEEIFGATEVGSIASRRTTAEEAWEPYPGVALEARPEGTVVTAPGAAPTPLADLVELHPDGRFRLLGRGADLVKLAGRRASLAGLNLVLAGLDGVEDAAFLAPDGAAEGRARLLAFVVAPGRSAEELLTELRRRIEPAFLPRRLIRVDRLPRNELGKLPRGALLALRAEVEAAAVP